MWKIFDFCKMSEHHFHFGEMMALTYTSQFFIQSVENAYSRNRFYVNIFSNVFH